MLKEGSDFLFEISVIRDNRSRDNESQIYSKFKPTLSQMTDSKSENKVAVCFLLVFWFHMHFN